MKSSLIASLCCLLSSAVLAQTTFEEPFRLESGGEVIDVNTGHAAPYLIDFDGDGVRDLLVGEFGKGSMDFEGTSYSRGRLRIYRNVGSERKPRYDGFEWFKAGGKIAEVPITCCVSFCPEPVDWDADGDMDMLTGSYPGQLYLYRNNGKGEYAAAEMIRNVDGDFVNPGHSTNVRTHDWDGDGDLDLVIATSSNVHLARNVGTRKAPRFDAALEKIAYRGETISMRGRLGVELTDWNGDGRTDMLLGLESAGVLVLYDTAKDGEPRFDESEVLIRIDRGMPLGGRLKMYVVDYNGDGLDDLLIGDVSWGRTTQPRPTPADKQSKEDEARKQRTNPAARTISQLVVDRDLQLSRATKRDLQAQINELLDIRRDERARERTEERSRERSNEPPQTEAKSEESEDGGTHGNVWVYLRKKPAGDVRSAFEGYPASGNPRLELRLGSESETIQPGEPFRLGLLFDLQDGWFTYSGIEGSAPKPTALDVHLPDGFKIAGMHWPEPIYKASPIMAGKKVGTYSKDFVVTLTIEPPSALLDEAYDIRVNTDWQVCNGPVCTLGESYNRITLRTGEARPTKIANWLAPSERSSTMRPTRP